MLLLLSLSLIHILIGTFDPGDWTPFGGQLGDDISFTRTGGIEFADDGGAPGVDTNGKEKRAADKASKSSVGASLAFFYSSLFFHQLV